MDAPPPGSLPSPRVCEDFPEQKTVPLDLTS